MNSNHNRNRKVRGIKQLLAEKIEKIQAALLQRYKERGS